MKKIVGALVCLCIGLVAGDFKQGLEELNGKKDTEAYATFFKLAKSGDVESQTLLGEMYLDGIGTKVDASKAFYWISKAASSGDKDALYLLGFMYENGIKVAVNVPRAVILYTKAAKQGDILAQYNLAMIYKEGRDGVAKDMKKAYKWLARIEIGKDKLEYQARAD